MTNPKINSQKLQTCPICGTSSFTRNRVLWDRLVTEWGLSPEEHDYIDDQQGLRCDNCKSNLRSMTLAFSILATLGRAGLFSDFCAHDQAFRKLRVLEINEAGSLSPYLKLLPHYLLAAYPQYDIQDLSFSDSQFDLVVHSDTLEHIPNGIQALKECKRVLAPGGFLAYTIPIIPDRLTRSRENLSPSFHGREGNYSDDLLVHREYGSDFWGELFMAGFDNARMYSLLYPASIAVVALN